MKRAYKWNFKTRRYSNIEIDDKCKCIADLEELVECPQCGTVFKFKDSYTSRQMHNKCGFGYAVCSQCYYNEIEEWREAAREGAEE